MNSFTKSQQLLMIRITQYGVPLLLLPILIHRVGLEGMGELAFWNSICIFISLVVGMNMDTFACGQIFKNKQKKSNVDIYIQVPLLIKLSFSFVFFVFWLVFSVAFIERDRFLLVLFSFYAGISPLMFFNFYYVATSDFSTSLWSVILEKFIPSIFIYVFVTSADESYLIPIFYFLFALIAIIFNLNRSGFWKVRSYANRKLRLKILVFKYFKSSLVLLLGKVTQFYTSFSKFIFGYFVGFESVAIYDVLEKVVNVAKVPLIMIAQLFFSKKESGYLEVFKLFLIQLSLSIAFVAGIYFYSTNILRYFFSESYLVNYDSLLNVLSLVLLSVPVVQVLGFNFVAKYLSGDVYGRILLCSNILSAITLCFLFLFDLISFYNLLLWIVGSEFIFAFLLILICFLLGNKVFYDR